MISLLIRRSPNATENPTSATRPCTSTSEVTNASERAWLKPSAARSLTNASLTSFARPVSTRVLRASSPVSFQVSGTLAAVLMSVSSVVGTQTVIADGSISTVSFLTGLRSPPSSSYRILRSNFTCTEVALVTWTKGDALDDPTAVRAIVRVHSRSPSAVTTPSSSFPSSGLASSNASTPAKSFPTFPMRTLLAWPSNHVAPSTSILAPNGLRPSCFVPVQTYASRPKRSFNPPSASLIICASKPAPAITAKRSSFMRPTSRVRRVPSSPMRTACSMSCGISRLEAKRFAVPAGTIATVASDPDSASMQR